MSDFGDFIVTLHALERLEQRFPDFVEGHSDEMVGRRIMDECIAASTSGRTGNTPPLEFAFGWLRRRAGHFFCWTEDRSRCYVLHDDGEVTYVLTVIRGATRNEALTRIVA